MITISASIHDQAPERILASVEDLDAVLDEASAEAQTKGRLNIVILSASNRDWLSIVLGSEETVVSFNYGHGDPLMGSRWSLTDESTKSASYGPSICSRRSAVTVASFHFLAGSLVSEHYPSILTLQSTRTRLRRAGYLGR